MGDKPQHDSMNLGASLGLSYLAFESTLDLLTEKNRDSYASFLKRAAQALECRALYVLKISRHGQRHVIFSPTVSRAELQLRQAEAEKLIRLSDSWLISHDTAHLPYTAKSTEGLEDYARLLRAAGLCEDPNEWSIYLHEPQERNHRLIFLLGERAGQVSSLKRKSVILSIRPLVAVLRELEFKRIRKYILSAECEPIAMISDPVGNIEWARPGLVSRKDLQRLSRSYGCPSISDLPDEWEICAISPGEIIYVCASVTRASHTLSNREQQVVELVAAGLSNKEVGRRLGIAPSTVANHLGKI